MKTNPQWCQNYLKRPEKTKTLKKAIKLLPTGHYLGFIDPNDPHPWCVATSNTLDASGQVVEASEHITDGKTWREAIESAIRLTYEEVYLFDPHPGVGGALMPLPQEVKEVADKLADQTMTLAEALSRLRGTNWVRATPSAVRARKGMILLDAELNGQIHHWRILRYRKVAE